MSVVDSNKSNGPDKTAKSGEQGQGEPAKGDAETPEGASRKGNDAQAKPDTAPRGKSPDGPVKPERAEGNKGKNKAPRASAEERARAKEDYRHAKTELKLARKRAGKSNAPKIVACVLVACLLVAGGAAAGWFFTERQGTQEISALQGQLASTRQQLDDANTKVDETSSLLAGGSRAYSGNWSGELISTLGSATKRCYGASERGFSLDIENISPTGQMQLSAKAPYHGHETATLENDVTHHEGDEVLSADNVTSTFSSKSFSFRIDGGKEGDCAVVTVSPTTSADAHIQLGVVVESYYRDGLVETDQYLLKKAGDDSSAAEGQPGGSASADDSVQDSMAASAE